MILEPLSEHLGTRSRIESNPAAENNESAKEGIGLKIKVNTKSLSVTKLTLDGKTIAEANASKEKSRAEDSIDMVFSNVNSNAKETVKLPVVEEKPKTNLEVKSNYREKKNDASKTNSANAINPLCANIVSGYSKRRKA